THKVTVQPGGSLGWHWHPGVVVLNVQKGTLTRVTKFRSRPGCTVETFPAGTSFIKEGTDPVNLSNLGSEPVEMYVIYIKPEGTPLRYNAEDPGC
ncbi:MAG TPA: cupin domain-containing protein, partial [Micromonosporaceae bacterium]|nr:cupin domain-containing protein [Micromonosporaceae bacterium]